MAHVPEYILARRNQRERERERRRRRLGYAAGLAALVAVGAVVAIVIGAGAAAHRTVHRTTAGIVGRPRSASRMTRPRPDAVSALEARGVERIRQLAALGLPVYCGGRRGRDVAFTFDDGPGPYTHYALHKLAVAHQRATFFVVGRSMRNFPGWVERETAVATLGDHTMTHPYLPGLDAASIARQLAQTKGMIAAALHRPVVLFRPPYGARNATVDATARRLGMLEVLWSVDSRDSLGANWAGIIRNVEAGLRPGAIILMHENRGQTIRALTTLLPELRRRGLRAVTLPELFAMDPPSLAQLHAGEQACGIRAVRSTGS